MAFFDHYSLAKPTAFGSKFVKRSAQLLYSHIKSVHPDATVALEIGPGKGDFCDFWLSQGGAITAMEANSDMGQELADKGVQVVEAFAPPLPFESSNFDIVVASHVIEHMPTATKAVELVEEMARVCRPGGIVCIVAPDIRSWKFDFWNADYTHNYVTSSRRLEQLFFNSGLNVEISILMSGPFVGFRRVFFNFIAMHLPSSSDGVGFWRQKFYKLKLTFLGNFMLIGRKL